WLGREAPRFARACERPARHPRARHHALQDRLGDRERAEIDRRAVAIRRSQNLDIASDPPIEAEHAGIEITEDRLDTGVDGDFTQRRKEDARRERRLLAAEIVLVD